MPLCAAKPECRNFVCVPSTQHSSSPAAQLPAVPAAQASCSTSSPRILPAPDTRCRTARRARSDESRGDGTARTTRCRRGRRSRWRRDRQNRARVRSPAASRPARARPPPRDCSCARSTRCACRRTRAPATARRWRTPPSARRARRRLPKIRAGPGGDSAAAAAIVDRPNGVSAPASARPITSRMRSLVASMTSEGRSSYRTSDTHSAT